MAGQKFQTWGDSEQARIQAWPMLKWRRAIEHMHGLAARVETFNERRAYVAPVRLSADRQIFLFIRPDGVQPPLEEWVLYFADAVHNLRTALDSLAWELAVMDGSVPADPRRIYFPVARTEAAWTAAAQNMDTVGAEFLSRIRSVQPFAVDFPPDNHYLSMLTDLDNAEKHRRTLVSRFDLAELSMEGSWSFEEEETPGEASFRFHTLEEPGSGDVIAEFHWGAAVKEGSDIPKGAPISVTPMVSLRGDYLVALEFLPNVAGWVRETIDFVRRGETAEFEAED